MARIHARVRRLEEQCATIEPPCPTCGSPSRLQTLLVAWEDDLPRARCEACGRELNPEGHPLARDAVRVVFRMYCDDEAPPAPVVGQ